MQRSVLVSTQVLVLILDLDQVGSTNGWVLGNKVNKEPYMNPCLMWGVNIQGELQL